MECRDMAQVLATTRGGKIDGLAQLDRHIEEAIGRYFKAPSPSDE